jgi:hypothetical protein
VAETGSLTVQHGLLEGEEEGGAEGDEPGPGLGAAKILGDAEGELEGPVMAQQSDLKKVHCHGERKGPVEGSSDVGPQVGGLFKLVCLAGGGKEG